MLCEEMEAFEPVLPTEIRKSVKLFEILAHNNKYASSKFFIALRVYVTSVATSDVFKEISDVWCFGDKSDVDWADIFVFHVSSLFRMQSS